MHRILFIATVALATLHSIPADVFADDGSIIVQSTSSTQNSGLFDHILPQFEAETGIAVNVVAVGTGQALKNAEKGDGDVVLVHARQAEDAFVEQGFGVERFDVMYNDFVLVGPPDDPAGIAGTSDITGALSLIAQHEALFASRGDDSGTHKKERALWAEANLDPTAGSGLWYRETGSGMGATLNAAISMGAYTLTDRATWLAFGNKGKFGILVEGDDRLFNPYGVILVNPELHPHVNAKDGMVFIEWLLSDKGQAAIASYQVDGQQLFFPNAQ